MQKSTRSLPVIVTTEDRTDAYSITIVLIAATASIVLSKCNTNQGNSRLETQSNGDLRTACSCIIHTKGSCKKKEVSFLPGVLETKAPPRFTFTPGSDVLRVCADEFHLPAAGNVTKGQPHPTVK